MNSKTMEITIKSYQLQKRVDLLKVDVVNSNDLMREQNINESIFYKQTKIYYDRCAEFYDYLYPDHIKYSKKLFDNLEPIFHKNGVKNILDASCGVGHDMICLLDKGFIVDGADISLSMIDLAKTNLRNKGYDNCTFFQLDVREIGERLKGGVYDAVIFRGNTFSNIHPYEIGQTFKQLSRLVNEGGFVLIDYRSGTEQIKHAKKFELRGYGKNRRSVYLSYYLLKHSLKLKIPYQVNAIIWCYNQSNFSQLNKIKMLISSYYVDDNIVQEHINSYFSDSKLIKNESIGLPYLKSILLRK